MDNVQKSNNDFIKTEMDAIKIQLDEISKQVTSMSSEINQVHEQVNSEPQVQEMESDDMEPVRQGNESQNAIANLGLLGQLKSSLVSDK